MSCEGLPRIFLLIEFSSLLISLLPIEKIWNEGADDEGFDEVAWMRGSVRRDVSDIFSRFSWKEKAEPRLGAP